jgi:hypothetical protein
VNLEISVNRPVDIRSRRYNTCKNFLRTFLLDALDSFRVFCADASPVIIPKMKKPAAVGGAGSEFFAMMSLCPRFARRVKLGEIAAERFSGAPIVSSEGDPAHIQVSQVEPFSAALHMTKRPSERP